MEKQKLKDLVFYESDDMGFLYSKAKDDLIKDVSVEDEKIKVNTCKFLIRKDRDKEYEEPIDFSVDDNDLYVRDLPINTNFAEQEYRLVHNISESECSSCQGSGSYCDNCRDTGSVSCTCHRGYKSETCSNCSGSGKVEVLSNELDEKTIQCGECDGSGKLKHSHSKCNGSGKIQCKECLAGQKDIECSNCLGEGTVSLVNVTQVKYKVRENTSEVKSKGVRSSNNSRVDSSLDYKLETVSEETYDELPDPDDTVVDDSVLYPIPDGEKVKIEYTSEEVNYNKVDLKLRGGYLDGDYDDDEVDHTVWIYGDDDSAIDTISAKKSKLSMSLISILTRFIVFGLWAGTIASLILFLPVSLFHNYIISMPDVFLVLSFALIWLAVNWFVLWESALKSRYGFEI